jgi:cellulose synthase/poly-beta-1,6-N-acetylglucosamine synthase-like glycosyltransferase
MIFIEIIILFYFLYSVFYTLGFSIAGNLRTKSPAVIVEKEKLNSIAVLIPAYKEDAVIKHIAIEALKQEYPANFFDVVVIADSLEESTLQKLRELPLKVIKVKFDKSTKVKSLNRAFAELPDDYDLALILDADNIMEPDFLRKINSTYNNGHRVIQGRRVAKNLNTSFAILDALSEVINNHIYRKGHHALGFSSSLIGSGMAFDYSLLKKTMGSMDSIGGFDRELELKLLRQGHKAIYLKDAIVYDEKVEKPKVFANQRRRWISSQYVYLKKYFINGISSLLKGDLVYFNSSILRNIQLPRLLNLGFLAGLALATSLISELVNIAPVVWWTLLVIYGLSFIIAIPLSFYSKSFFKAIANLPVAFVLMLLSLLKFKGANSTFIHTPHSNLKVQPEIIRKKFAEKD